MRAGTEKLDVVLGLVCAPGGNQGQKASGCGQGCQRHSLARAKAQTAGVTPAMAVRHRASCLIQTDQLCARSCCDQVLCLYSGSLFKCSNMAFPLLVESVTCFFKSYFILSCIWELWLHIYLGTMCMPGDLRGQRRTLDLLEMEFQTV